MSHGQLSSGTFPAALAIPGICLWEVLWRAWHGTVCFGSHTPSAAQQESECGTHTRVTFPDPAVPSRAGQHLLFIRAHTLQCLSAGSHRSRRKTSRLEKSGMNRGVWVGFAQAG